MIPLIAFLIAALIILPMFWLNWGATPEPYRQPNTNGDL